MPAVCPLLGRPTETEPTPYERHGFRLVRCLETDFIYMENPPAYDELRDPIKSLEKRLFELEAVYTFDSLLKQVQPDVRARRIPTETLLALGKL